jgi:carbon monoxide dehydrogenase subunit G
MEEIIMLDTLVLLVALLIVLVLLYTFKRPDRFRIARTQGINAPPEKIFPYINDLRALNTWLPFLKPDPDIRLTYSGPSSGRGALNEFDGNRQVGAGRVEITESIPHSKVVMRLQMSRPMACDNTVEFTLRPNGDNTDITWAMEGKSSFMSKLVGILINTDKMVGAQFEKGLADLKALAEK